MGRIDMNLCKDIVPSCHNLLPYSEKNSVTVVVCPHPFSSIKHIYEVTGNKNLISIMLEIGCTLRGDETYAVCVSGTPIPMNDWVSTFPSSGQLMTIRCIPVGGGDDKNILQILVGIIIVAVAIFVPELAPALVSALTSVGAGLIANGVFGLIFPAPDLSLPETETPGRVSSLTGVRNRANPHGTIPRVFGKHRIYPLYAAVPYTEIVGEDQYLICLFCLGYGPLTLSEFKIGETDLSEYDEVEYYEHHSHTGDEYDLNIYEFDVFEEAISAALEDFSITNDPSSFTVRTTPVDVERISLDFVYPQGIIYINKSGRPQNYTMGVSVWYRKHGETGWLRSGVGSADLTMATRTLQRQNVTFKVPKGQYDVGVTRSVVFRDEDQDGEDRIFYSNTIQWGILRSFKKTPPIKTTKNLVLIEMKIRASDQLNGTLNSFNCVAEAHLQTYDAGVWSVNKTQNAAWAYTSVLLDEANAQKLGTPRININVIKAWADWCETNNFYYNRIQDTKNTVFEQLREIAGAGRASFHILDGLYSVVRDIPQTTPVQLFSPRNSANYKGDKIFIKEHPHALRIPFVNEERGYTDDEATVYDDGYNQNNATLFESLPFPGVTKFSQVYRQGRYFIAQARLRPEMHSIKTDIEHLTCTRGDLIEVVQDVINLGVGSGRVKTVNFSGSDVESIVLDTEIPVTSGVEYGVHIRRPNDERRIIKNVEVLTVNPKTDLFTFSTAIDNLEDLPEEGDLVFIGVRSEVGARFIVRSIEHSGDMQATISFVQEAPALHQVDIGTIPIWDPQITNLTIVESRRPPIPSIISIRSDESVLLRDTDGSLKVQIVLGLSIQTWKHSDELFYQVRYRRSDPEGQWDLLPAVPTETDAISIQGVEEGVSYDISVRSLTTALNLDSPWSIFLRHSVIGKLTPPPDVTSFFAERQTDGGRIISWDLLTPPLDLAGYILRFKEQASSSRIRFYQYRQRRTNGSPWSIWMEIPNSHLGGPNFTEFTIMDLPGGQELEFQLRAALIGGVFSDPSSTVVTTPG